MFSSSYNSFIISSESKFPKRDPKSVQQATLCFLVNDGKILLAMKKRGFGVGLWNGAGGKIHKGETIIEAAHREAHEELGIHLLEADKVANLHFYFPDDPKKKDWNQDVHVFLAERWEGKPKETEEMSPRWFKSAKLPLAKMWADDKFWLPRVLSGEMLEGWFAFDDNEDVLEYMIKNVEEGGRIS